MRRTRGLSQGLMPLALIAGLVALGAWAMRVSTIRKAEAARRQEERAIATTRVGRGAFEVLVTAVGRLEAVQSLPVVTEVSGQVVQIVPNGVRVKPGDVIAQLDIPRMARTLRQQLAEYQQAMAEMQARQQELATRVEQARLDLDRAQRELDQFVAQQESELAEKRAQLEFDQGMKELTLQRYERKKKLAAESLIPGQEIELAEADIKAKEYNVERQTKDLALDTERKASEKLDKEAAVQRAQSELRRAQMEQQFEAQNLMMRVQINQQQLDRARHQVEKATIRAPADGIVVLVEQREGMSSRVLEAGDRVWEGRTVAELPDLTKMRVVVDVPQAQARKVKRKQQVRITLEALPGLELEGEVTEIAQTAGEPERGRGRMGIPGGEKGFRTEILIKDTKGAALRPGMTANVAIIVERIRDAITVPLVCVFDRDDRKVVYVRREGHFEAVEVQLGPDNQDVVVIRKGLKGGEEISLRDLTAGSDESVGAGAEEPAALPL